MSARRERGGGQTDAGVSKRIDSVDVISNILYVSENRVKLAKLAHHFLQIERDRPEVCCMVGAWPFYIRTPPMV